MSCRCVLRDECKWLANGNADKHLQGFGLVIVHSVTLAGREQGATLRANPRLSRAAACDTVKLFYCAVWTDLPPLLAEWTMGSRQRWRNDGGRDKARMRKGWVKGNFCNKHWHLKYTDII